MKKTHHFFAVWLVVLGIGTHASADCYKSVGNPAHNRFGAGPVSQCNVSGYGSSVIGTAYNTILYTNDQVRRVYREAQRDARSAHAADRM